MPTLADLLSDPTASIEIIAKISYLSAANIESTEWVSQRGWTDPLSGPVAAYIPPLLDTGLEISQHIDPLNPQESFGTYTQLVLINNLSASPYIGRYDGWHRNSIDSRAILIYLVGVLTSGTRVELTDVLTTPMFSLKGVEVADVDESTCVLTVRDDSHSLDLALQPVTYSPPCLAFPGTTAGVVDFGDNYDQAGSWSASGWVYLEDPTAAAQYFLYKTEGTTGYYFGVGGVLTLFIAGQTPPTTTAPNTLHARYWHFLSISVDTSAHTREIGIDGVSVGTTGGITGSPVVNALHFLWGVQVRGKLSRWVIYNTARTVAAMWADAHTPVLPTASNLTAYFPTDEGLGTTIHDRKSSSSITGTTGTDVMWDIASWHLSGIVGNYRPYVLGTVARVPASWIDLAAQVAEVSYGGCALISEVQSNHNALGAIWSPNLPAGTLAITSGALNGTYSATVTANNLWNTALQVGSTTTILGSTVVGQKINTLTGGVTLYVQFTPSSSQTSGYILGWSAASLTAGMMGLRYASGSANRLEGYCVNDAGTIFLATTTISLKEGRTYSLAIDRGPNTTPTYLSVSVDGELAETIPITGAYTTTSVSTWAVGCRGDVSPGAAGTQAQGRYDEPLIFQNALTTQTYIRTRHLLPAGSAESANPYGWHFDDATGTSAAAISGTYPLTLTNATWVGGRSSAADLGRKVFYLAGYQPADLDVDSWRNCLNLLPADCGWYIGSGETALDTLRLILGGLGFVIYKAASTIHVRRFVGLTGSPDTYYTGREDVRADAIQSQPHDPPVWQWQTKYRHNDTKLSASNIAGALATSDPDRYQYGQVDDLLSTRGDASIKVSASGGQGRFPSAIPKARQTALINQRDADDETARLLALHRDSSDSKSVPMWLLDGNAAFMSEVVFSDITECEMDMSDWVVVGVDLKDDAVTVVVWRPATQAYGIVGRVTDDGSVRVADDGSVRITD